MASDAILPPWSADATSASGQVFEFRLWALLTEQSRGRLHVFLPLADRGIDALVHRLTDDAYIPIQAKCRSTLVDGEVHLVVWASSLNDDDALIVSGLLTEGGLGPTMLAVPEGDFKRLAELSTWDGRPVYSMGFGMNPRQDSRWFSYLVSTDRLYERFGIVVGAEELAASPPHWRSDLGFLGEAEAGRLLAERSDLNQFRAFPDMETSELVVRHMKSRRVLGLQIKTIGIDSTNRRGTVSILESSFRPSPTTYMMVLAWIRDQQSFHEECLIVPCEEVGDISEPSAKSGHLQFDWHPGSALTKLAKYSHPLLGLGTVVEQFIDSRPPTSFDVHPR